MLTKEGLEKQIIDGIKAGRLDPCNDVKQAMLDIVDELGVDDWYDRYQEA